MNIIINKYKSFVIIFCLSVFMFYSFIPPKKAYSVVGVDDAVLIGGGVVVSTGAILALVGSTLVAGGVALDVTKNDGKICKYVSQKLIDSGTVAQSLGVKTLENGKQFLTWTKEGISNISDYLNDTILNGISTPLPIGYSVGGTGSSNIASNPISFTVSLPVRGSVGLVVHKSDGSVKGISSPTVNAGTYTFKLYYDNYVKFGVPGLAVYPYMSTEISPYTVITDAYIDSIPDGSICIDEPSTSAKEWDKTKAQDVIGGDVLAQDGSISYAPSMGIPLNPSISSDKVLDSSIPFPFDRTWDKDLSKELEIPSDKVQDNVGDNVGDTAGSITDGILNIPILGVILKALLDILAFLKGFLLSLINALKDLLISLFVPSSVLLKEKFISIQNNLNNAFPTNFDVLNQLKNATSSDPNLVYSFKVMGVNVKLDLNFIKIIVNVSRTIGGGLVAIFLTWYHYRHIVHIIRGTSPITGDGHIGQSNSPISEPSSNISHGGFSSGNFSIKGGK